MGDVDFEDPANAGDDEGWETEDEMEAEEEPDDSDLTFSKHSGTGRQPCITISSEKKSFLILKLCFSCFCFVSRFCFLCEFGSGHKQHGSDGRRGRQSLRLESE